MIKCKFDHDDPDGIPKLLCRICNPNFADAWKNFKPREEAQQVVDINKERVQRAQAMKKEAAERARKEHEARKKKPVEKIDTTGKRWNPRKSRWEEDKFGYLAQPAKPVKLDVKKINGGKPVSIEKIITEGTNRAKLAKAMMKRIGEMVTLAEWSKAVYGKTNEGPCAMVIKGFIVDLAKHKLPFEIIKDKNSKGEVTFGIFPIDKS